VLRADGTLGLLDWESAEPHGLPGLDLAYLLANAAFVLDGALDSGRTAESYARLLDPAGPRGAEATRCSLRYCRAAGIEAEQLARLRLLAWVRHSHSDFRHLAMAAAGAPSPEALRESVYLGLIGVELEAGG
jgi:aminoglycoside phosphotransferase (APT) family kinase protein